MFDTVQSARVRVLMGSLLALVLVASTSGAAEMRDLSLTLPDGGTLLYGLAAPDAGEPAPDRPLVLALHPGGGRMRYYGSAYARAVVLPALGELGAIVVAPDCPSGSWTDPAADKAILYLLDVVMRAHRVDRRRVLVVGYSMGGRGTWFMASRHHDLFTAAIPMAASTGDDPIETLGLIPTYVIHSRRDEVVPFAPAARQARELERLGRRVRLDVLDEPTHFQMGAYVPALRRGVTWVAAQWSATR